MRIIGSLVIVSVLATLGCGGEGRGNSPQDYGELGRAQEELMVGPHTLLDLNRGATVFGRAREIFMGRSAAVLTHHSVLVNNTLTTFNFDLCTGEVFDETKALPPLGTCSSALVGDALILTAKHCVYNQVGNPLNLANLRVVFGYDVIGPGFNTQADTNVSPDDVYTPTSIVAEGSEVGVPGDWALLSLDRTVSPHYRRLRIQGSPTVNTDVYMFGYPKGLAVKYSTPGNVWTSSDNFWRATISGQAGNSGSAVLASNGDGIVGVLTFGPNDLEFDPERQCDKWFVCPECSMGGAGAAEIVQHVPTPPTSCAGACGGHSPDGCWCDAACVGLGDCCSDATSLCQPHWNPPPNGSCANWCGSNAGGCWCDLACNDIGDCCSDYYQTCGRSNVW